MPAAGCPGGAPCGRGAVGKRWATAPVAQASNTASTSGRPRPLGIMLQPCRLAAVRQALGGGHVDAVGDRSVVAATCRFTCAVGSPRDAYSGPDQPRASLPHPRPATGLLVAAGAGLVPRRRRRHRASRAESRVISLEEAPAAQLGPAFGRGAGGVSRAGTHVSSGS